MFASGVPWTEELSELTICHWGDFLIAEWHFGSACLLSRERIKRMCPHPVWNPHKHLEGL